MWKSLQREIQNVSTFFVTESRLGREVPDNTWIYQKCLQTQQRWKRFFFQDQFSLILFTVQTTYFHPATRWRTCTTGSNTSAGWRMRSSSKNSSEHDMQYKMIVMIVYTQLYMQTCFPWFDWFDGRVIEERVRNQEWSGRVKDTREKMNKLYDENRC